MAQAVIEPGALGRVLDVTEARAYVERCRTPDGGYFFARVPPASARDTYHALEVYSILGADPPDKGRLAGWIEETAASGVAADLYGLFYLTKAAGRLGLDRRILRARAEGLLGRHLVAAHRRGALYVEVPSELEATHMAVEISLDLGLPLAANETAAAVLGLRNLDGGFGGGGRSTLASTYFAVQVLAKVCPGGWPRAQTAGWLRRCEAAWRVQFLEHLFWLHGALATLGCPMERPEDAARFVFACKRRSGGFARAPVGISTLEDTHRALGILKELGYLQ